MTANENFKEHYRARLISDVNDEGDESMWMWKRRTLQLFYVAVEIAESKLQEGQLLSEQLIVDSSSLNSFEEYASRAGKGSNVSKYLSDLPGFNLEGFYDAAAQHHKFAEMALVELLQDSDAIKIGFYQANNKFADECRERIKIIDKGDYISDIWIPRALTLIDVAMEVINDPCGVDRNIIESDLYAALQLPVLTKFSVNHPESTATRYLGALPGFVHGEEPGGETIRLHQYAVVGLRNSLGS